MRGLWGPWAEMEKAADVADAVTAIFFTGLLFFGFPSNFFHGFCLSLGIFCHFSPFLHNFEHFLHILCVLIFQTRSFANAIL